ncbi:hypothetical protein M422DRAFT_257102 [Sphaerobolus stellatus SS14]|uniref:Uncharacterized protein n=1 Tax=Sphaerobolus stellatus (strain SS14) TaxID=990650 RepID=A0A0C9UYS7_SPHS4|nr:hypothetical protein M422DRAFT_257102 [Sphaerobolus stellatus SS14]
MVEDEDTRKLGVWRRMHSTNFPVESRRDKRSKPLHHPFRSMPDDPPQKKRPGRPPKKRRLPGNFVRPEAGTFDLSTAAHIPPSIAPLGSLQKQEGHLPQAPQLSSTEKLHLQLTLS